MPYAVVIVWILGPIFAAGIHQEPYEDDVRARTEWRTICGAHAVMVPRDPNGPVLLTSVPKVRFDIDGDGLKELVTWPLEPANLAFLALDKNSNGIIDDGTELFTEHSTPGVGDGLSAYIRFFEQESIPPSADVSSKLFPLLLLWNDLNRDGVTQPGELSKAEDTVVSLGTGTWRDDDTPLFARYQTGARYKDAKRTLGTIYDVCLQTPTE